MRIMSDETKKSFARRPSKRLRMSPTDVGGFCSAASILESSKKKEQDSPAVQDVLSPLVRNAPPSPAKAKETPFQMTLTIVGYKYHQESHKSPPTHGTAVVLKREPDNEHDANAIAVLTSETKLQIGHIRKEDAELLAPHFDSGALCTSAASIRVCLEGAFVISAEGISNGSLCVLSLLNKFQRVVESDPSSRRIASSDVERSQTAPYKMQDLKALSWNPIADDAVTQEPFLSWKPFDPSKKLCPLTQKEIQDAHAAQWPPSDALLLRLGMAPADDEAWYHETSGVLPPSQWKVAGALDLLPHIQISLQSHKQKAAAALDGAMHGVTQVWTDDTLSAMRELMHEPSFWCRRSGDALIRAFGGPYVLGQNEENLKLVRGAPHSELTRKMCVAHNLVYTAVHLSHPVAPGFNTLIFGCNLRGSGFHYHQDAIPNLKAKNAPLVPKQPVVTTVFYENPMCDTGKELVLWKPMLNFSPINHDANSNGEYLAARAVTTEHGMIHVQRAGLQKSAVHGIFHATGASERQGYRVAITARITKPDAEASVRPFEKQYCLELGPLGDVMLPPSNAGAD